MSASQYLKMDDKMGKIFLAEPAVIGPGVKVLQ